MPMPKPVKVGLIVLLVLVVLGGVTCGGFVAWVKSNEADWRLKGKEAKKEGQFYGAQHAGADCLEEALRRADHCATQGALDKSTCQAFVGAFFDQCLTASKQGGRLGESLCEGVPEEGVLAQVAYSKKKCDARGELTEPCMKSFQNLAQWCVADRAQPDAEAKTQ